MANKKEFNANLQAMSTTDLQARATEEAIRLRKLKFTHTITPLESSAVIKALRRDVARINTELSRRKNNA